MGGSATNTIDTARFRRGYQSWGLRLRRETCQVRIFRAVGALFFTARSLNEVTMFDHVMLGRGMTIMIYHGLSQNGFVIWKLSKGASVFILYIDKL